MSPNFAKMSLPQRIVWFFEFQVTEAHRDSICYTLKLKRKQFDQAIPEARDIGLDAGLRLTPIYEREGWWTADPTERIAAIALRESVVRNLGEAERNARVYDSFHKVGDSARIVEQTNVGNLSSIEAQLPEITMDPAFDYVLDRVDKASEVGKRYVPLAFAGVAA